MNKYKVIGNPNEIILDAKSKGQAKRIFMQMFPKVPILGTEQIEWTFSDPDIEEIVNRWIDKDADFYVKEE